MERTEAYDIAQAHLNKWVQAEGRVPSDWMVDAVMEAAVRAGKEARVDLSHPLFQAFHAAVSQATSGKGQRHGGAATPFYDQAWLTIAQAQGTGFLAGQAEKKLHEAGERIQKGEGQAGDEAWCREVLGALVYGGMAWLHATGRAKRGAPADTGLTAEVSWDLGKAIESVPGKYVPGEHP